MADGKVDFYKLDNPKICGKKIDDGKFIWVIE